MIHQFADLVQRFNLFMQNGNLSVRDSQVGCVSRLTRTQPAKTINGHQKEKKRHQLNCLIIR